MGQVNITKHRILTTPKNTQPIHSVSYRAKPKAREFKNTEIYKMLSQKVFKAAKAGLAAAIVFAPKKDRSLRFRVTYRKFNAIVRLY